MPLQSGGHDGRKCRIGAVRSVTCIRDPEWIDGRLKYLTTRLEEVRVVADAPARDQRQRYFGAGLRKERIPESNGILTNVALMLNGGRATPGVGFGSGVAVRLSK